MKNFYSQNREAIESVALAVAFVVAIFAIFILPTYPGHCAPSNAPYAAGPCK